MPLPELVPGPSPVDVQHTTFSADPVGRYVCSTWHEAIHNGGPPLSVVVVGGGMYGAYLTARPLPSQSGCACAAARRRAMVRSHAEPPAPGLRRAWAIAPQHDPGTARAHVWGLPWRGSVDFPGLT